VVLLWNNIFCLKLRITQTAEWNLLESEYVDGHDDVTGVKCWRRSFPRQLKYFVTTSSLQADLLRGLLLSAGALIENKAQGTCVIFLSAMAAAFPEGNFYVLPEKLLKFRKSVFQLLFGTSIGSEQLNALKNSRPFCLYAVDHRSFMPLTSIFAYLTALFYRLRVMSSWLNHDLHLVLRQSFLTFPASRTIGVARRGQKF